MTSRCEPHPMHTPDELRRIRRRHLETCHRLYEAHRAECDRVTRLLESDSPPVPPPEYPPEPDYPPFPEECRGMT